MSLRFTDTSKWADPWFLELPPMHKLIHQYLCDSCDCAGVWNVSLRDMQFRTGATEQEFYEFVKQAGDGRIAMLDSGRKLWLVKFIPFQYRSGFNIRNHIVKGIALCLSKVRAPLKRLPNNYYEPILEAMDSIHSIKGDTRGTTLPLQGVKE